MADQRDDEGGSDGGLRTGRRTFMKGSAAALGTGLVSGVGSAATETDGAVEGVGVNRAVDDEGMVATVHPRATEIGVRVLQNGGNAVDAACAVQFALNVVQPHSSGIGGGGFMEVYVAEEDELYTVDNRERAPLGAEKGMFLDENGDPIPFEQRHTSGDAVGVPGTLRAIDVALKRFGSRNVPELVDPAIALASGAEEVTVDAELAAAIENNYEQFNDAAQAVFAPGGDPLQEGDPLVQPDLAETFRLIREGGIGVFYKGRIAEAVAETVQNAGGSMRVDDLARYNVTIDHPEYAEFNDVTVRTQSLPSSGGLTIGQILKLLEEKNLSQYDRYSGCVYEALLEAFGLAYADRGAFMGDKAFVDAPWQGLFDEDYLAERRDLIPIDGSAGDPPQPGNPWDYQPGEPYTVDAVGADELRNTSDLSGPPQPDTGQTTHFTVADDEGNLVSWTSTIEQFFGTKIMVPDYGFMLNNELTDFDAVPGGPNEVAPGKRPLSSTSPTIVFKDGDPFFTIGSPGGKTIITTVAQIILNVAEFGMDFADAVAAPRVYKDADPEVYWEEAIPQDVRSKLRSYGFQLRDDPYELGNSQGILVRDDGTYVGVADARRSGGVEGPE